LHPFAIKILKYASYSRYFSAYKVHRKDSYMPCYPHILVSFYSCIQVSWYPHIPVYIYAHILRFLVNMYTCIQVSYIYLAYKSWLLQNIFSPPMSNFDVSHTQNIFFMPGPWVVGRNIYFMSGLWIVARNIFLMSGPWVLGRNIFWLKIFSETNKSIWGPSSRKKNRYFSTIGWFLAIVPLLCRCFAEAVGACCLQEWAWSAGG